MEVGLGWRQQAPNRLEPTQPLLDGYEDGSHRCGWKSVWAGDTAAAYQGLVATQAVRRGWRLGALGRLEPAPPAKHLLDGWFAQARMASGSPGPAGTHTTG